MLIAGHTHSYGHVPAYREIIVGNGGAPLTSSTNYGYVIIARQPDGTLQATSYDYMTHAIVEQFSVDAGGRRALTAQPGRAAASRRRRRADASARRTAA